MPLIRAAAYGTSFISRPRSKTINTTTKTAVSPSHAPRTAIGQLAGPSTTVDMLPVRPDISAFALRPRNLQFSVDNR